MQAVDFLIYCCGIASVLMSLGMTVRLIRKQQVPKFVARAPDDEPTTAANDVGLVDRLQRFQDARFAPPIIQKQLERAEYVPSPGEPGGPRRIPPARVLQPRTRPFSTPRQPPPRPKDANVIPLPVKMPRPEDPTKKD